MYAAVVLTETYRVVQKGERQEQLEDAKKAAQMMTLEVGQMPGVIDDQDVVVWKGGIKRRIKVAKLALKNTD